MKYDMRTLLAVTTPLLAVIAVPSVASAQTELSSCGGVFVSGTADCRFVKDQECEEHCEGVSVEQSCAAELYASCETECTSEASTRCVTSCEPVCVDECMATPTPASSVGICRSDCAADCNTKCAGAEN